MFSLKCWKEQSKTKLNFLLVSLGALLTTGCFGGGGLDLSENLLGGGFAPGEVRPLEFGPDGQAILNFGELSGGEEFSLLFFAANVNEGNFGIHLRASADVSSDSQIKLLRSPAGYLPETQWQEGDITSNFHEQLRQEENLLGQVVRKSGAEKFMAGTEPGSQDISEPWNVGCDDGRGIQIKVINNLSNTDSYDIICGIERRVTGNAIYYVDKTVDGALPDSLINPIIDNFEGKIPRERTLIGQETDVNDDGRFAVCFCPSVNRLGAAAGGYVTGFFFGGDLFTQASILASNEKEILYISVPDPSGQYGTVVPTDFWASNIAPSVLPHEFQHMISYHYKVLQQEIGAEEAWANEALSHLLEDLHGNHADPLAEVGTENPSRVQLFLQATENAAFTGGTSLAQRGGAYLFYRYLYEQANLGRYPGVQDGQDLLSELISSPYKGVHNIEETTGWPFRNLLLDFYATLQLSDTGISGDSRYNFSGINLIGPQDDNRGTNLDGVYAFQLNSIPTSGAVSSPGGMFYNLGGTTIIEAGSSLSFSADPGMIPGGAVIRLH